MHSASLLVDGGCEARCHFLLCHQHWSPRECLTKAAIPHGPTVPPSSAAVLESLPSTLCTCSWHLGPGCPMCPFFCLSGYLLTCHDFHYKTSGESKQPGDRAWRCPADKGGAVGTLAASPIIAVQIPVGLRGATPAGPPLLAGRHRLPGARMALARGHNSKSCRGEHVCQLCSGPLRVLSAAPSLLAPTPGQG